MTTPTPDFLRNLAAAERLAEAKLSARCTIESAAGNTIAANLIYDAGFHAHARAAAFDALADEMDG